MQQLRKPVRPVPQAADGVVPSGCHSTAQHGTTARARMSTLNRTMYTMMAKRFRTCHHCTCRCTLVWGVAGNHTCVALSFRVLWVIVNGGAHVIFFIFAFTGSFLSWRAFRGVCLCLFGCHDCVTKANTGDAGRVSCQSQQFDSHPFSKGVWLGVWRG